MEPTNPTNNNILGEKDLEPKCKICRSPTSKYCGNCHKIYYCCSEHQKQDRKRHKPSCYPIQVVSNPVKGRCVITTRGIKAGEVILRDEELVAAPNGNILCTLSEFRPMCLSCFTILSSQLESNYGCTSCGWPLCNVECEKDYRHSAYECPIFSEHKIQPFNKAIDYDHIKILRALLLAQTNSVKWEQLMNLESHEVIREKLPNCRKKTFETVIFIRTTCGLTQFDYKSINYVVGVFRVNAFGNHNWPMLVNNKNGGASVTSNFGFREGTFLFYYSSLFAHNCIPNTRSFLTQELSINHNTKSESHFIKHLIATVDIPEGDEINISYIETRQGTTERRNILKRGYHFDCTCSRCSDPTEFGLYFSAIKCTQCSRRSSVTNKLENSEQISSNNNNNDDNNNEGYLILENSLKFKSKWKCNVCGIEKNWEEVVNTIEELQNVIEIAKAGKGDQFPQNVLDLEQILKEYKGSIVHCNHWLIIELEYDIIKYARNAFLDCYKNTAQDYNEAHSNSNENGFSDDKTLKSWKEFLVSSVQMINKITNHCLVIGDVLRPGISIFRGCLLFSLAQCQFISFEEAIKNENVENVNLNQMKLDLMTTLEEAKSILVIEPEGSEEFAIANEMYNVIVNNIKTYDLYFLKDKDNKL